MQNYELTYLIAPDLDGKPSQELSQKIEGLVANCGKVLRSGMPERIKLQYPVQKKGEGLLTTIEFQAEPQGAIELKEELKKIPEVIRFLLTKKREKKIAPPRASLKTEKEISVQERTKPQVLVDGSVSKKGEEISKQKETSAKTKVALEEIERDLEKIL